MRPVLPGRGTAQPPGHRARQPLACRAARARAFPTPVRVPAGRRSERHARGTEPLRPNTWHAPDLRPLRRYEAVMDTHLGKDGLPVSEVVGATPTSWLPRGCALSFTVRYLAEADPQRALALWNRYRQQFLVEQFLITGFREWPLGTDRPADADSGPIVHGVGAAASAFGIAAARHAGRAPGRESGIHSRPRRARRQHALLADCPGGILSPGCSDSCPSQAPAPAASQHSLKRQFSAERSRPRCSMVDPQQSAPLHCVHGVDEPSLAIEPVSSKIGCTIH